MTPEKKVQNSIIKYLKELENNNHPCYHERREPGGFAYKKGMPDLYAVYNGIHIEIEAKQEDGEQSSMQEKREEICKKLNMLYICVDNLQQFKDFMEYYFDISTF